MSEWIGQAYGIAELGREVLDVAPKGVTGVSGGVDGHADEGKARFAESQSGSSTTPEMAGSRSVTLGRSILRDSVVTCHTYDNAAQNEQVSTQASPADSHVSSELYLTASQLVDIVELSEQYRAEELAAAEEGALIEASGYQFPEYERNGR